MTSSLPTFREPTAVEKLFNRTFGFLVGLGLGPSHIYLLQVRGRKSGKLFSTPVDLLELQGKRYLVAPRGRTQWVRNAEAAGEITLKRGQHSPEIPSASNPEGRQAADPESLSRLFQARSATILPHRCRFASGQFSRHRRKLSSVRTAKHLRVVHSTALQETPDDDGFPFWEKVFTFWLYRVGPSPLGLLKSWG